MGAKNFAKESMEFNMFTDFWRLSQTYYIPEQTEKYWDQLLNEIHVFAERYINISLATELAIALTNDLNKRMKKAEKTKEESETEPFVWTV